MEVELGRHSDRTKVSCPHCQKMYLILLSDLLEENNRFVCKQCQQDFWLRKSDLEVQRAEALTGVPSESFVGKTKEKCPKCGHAVEDLDKECGSCGVVGAKFLALKDDSPYLKVSDSLKRLWKRVLNHYDDERVHHEFLSQCLKEKQLRYASLQYKQLKETLGADEIVKEMMTKIQNLSEMDMESKRKKPPTKDTSFSWYVRFLRWEMLVMGMGLMCVLYGLTSPLARNLVGLGVVFLAFPLLIRVFLRR